MPCESQPEAVVSAALARFGEDVVLAARTYRRELQIPREPLQSVRAQSLVPLSPLRKLRFVRGLRCCRGTCGSWTPNREGAQGLAGASPRSGRRSSQRSSGLSGLGPLGCWAPLSFLGPSPSAPHAYPHAQEPITIVGKRFPSHSASPRARFAKACSLPSFPKGQGRNASA